MAPTTAIAISEEAIEVIEDMMIVEGITTEAVWGGDTMTIVEVEGGVIEELTAEGMSIMEGEAVEDLAGGVDMITQEVEGVATLHHIAETMDTVEVEAITMTIPMVVSVLFHCILHYYLLY